MMLSSMGFSADLEATVIPTVMGGSTGEIDLNVSGGVAPFTYTWSGPGGFSSTDEDLMDLPEGTYSVTVTDQYCGVATLEVVVTGVDDNSSIDEPVLFELSVYPNPTTGLIYLNSSEDLDIVVYNVVGEVVLKASHVKQIDLTGNATGIYMLQASSTKGILTQKITLTN